MATVVNITNGQGNADLGNGNYNVTANVEGYQNNTLNPSEVDIVEGVNEYAFTIAACGTLILHVTEEGTPDGTVIEGATFIRTDSEGNEYGEEVVSDENGNAVFENVPYSSPNGITIYFKQTASDGNHSFDDQNKNILLVLQETVGQIINPPFVSRNITLTDANYENLPIETGTLTFE